MKNIKLRAMEPHDIEAIYRWENDPNVWKYSAAHQPFSRNTLEAFIEEQRGTDIYVSRQLRLMADAENGITVGCIDLFDFDPYHHRAGVGILVDSSHRHKGYGMAILAEATSFAKIHLQLHQLHSIIADGNKYCLRLFERAGYTPCGTLRQWIWNNNQWEDAHFYQKIIA